MVEKNRVEKIVKTYTEKIKQTQWKKSGKKIEMVEEKDREKNYKIKKNSGKNRQWKKYIEIEQKIQIVEKKTL